MEYQVGDIVVIETAHYGPYQGHVGAVDDESTGLLGSVDMDSFFETSLSNFFRSSSRSLISSAF